MVCGTVSLLYAVTMTNTTSLFQQDIKKVKTLISHDQTTQYHILDHSSLTLPVF